MLSAQASRDSVEIPPKAVSESVQEELDYWEKLVFTFDMDREPGESSKGGSGGERRRSGSTRAGGSSARGDVSNTQQTPSPTQNNPPPNFQGQFGNLDPYTIAQLAAAAAAMAPGGLQPNVHDPYAGIRQLQSMFQPNSAHPGSPTQHLPNQSHDNTTVHPGGMPGFYPQMRDQSQQARSPPVPMNAHQHMPFPFPQAAYPQQGGTANFANSGFGLPGPSNTGGQVQAPAPAQTDEADMDEAALSEDKRRRNTAASARFRIKKKHKTLELERSVADLEGRADDLEKEASNLRRENGWLKEMIIMKGSRARGTLPAQDTAEEDENADDEDDGEQQGRTGDSKGSKKGKEKADGGN